MKMGGFMYLDDSLFDNYDIRAVIYTNSKLVFDSLITKNQLITIPLNHSKHTVFFVLYQRSSQKRNFILTDKNYNGLPIEKGEIYLWPSI